jgi:hypothetical protein
MMDTVSDPTSFVVREGGGVQRSRPAAPGPRGETGDHRGYQAIFDAAERSRTSTALAGHKALNLARLPVPPQPRTRAPDSRCSSPVDIRPVEDLLYEHVFW